jgi:hypothetical protein
VGSISVSVAGIVEWIELVHEFKKGAANRAAADWEKALADGAGAVTWNGGRFSRPPQHIAVSVREYNGECAWKL